MQQWLDIRYEGSIRRISSICCVTPCAIQGLAHRDTAGNVSPRRFACVRRLVGWIADNASVNVSDLLLASVWTSPARGTRPTVPDMLKSAGRSVGSMEFATLLSLCATFEEQEERKVRLKLTLSVFALSTTWLSRCGQDLSIADVLQKKKNLFLQRWPESD